MGKKDSSNQPEQRYSCDRPGCDKSYSRPDHLLRHKLNHDVDRVLCCNQCDRTFVRQDLLVRHLERHALRGKTLGRWSNKGKDKPQTSAQGSGSSCSKSDRRNSKAAQQASHDASDSEDDDQHLDPTLTTAGHNDDDDDIDGMDEFKRGRIGVSGSGSSHACFQGTSTHGEVTDVGPSTSVWPSTSASSGGSLVSGQPPLLSASVANQHNPHHPPLASHHSGLGGAPGGYPSAQSQWSPPAASASPTAAMSPPFRSRINNLSFASIYGESSRNGQSPADLLAYESGGRGGSRGGQATTSEAAGGGRAVDVRGGGYDDFPRGSSSNHPLLQAPWHDGAFPATASSGVGRSVGDGGPTADPAEDPASFRWLEAGDLGGGGDGPGGRDIAGGNAGDGGGGGEGGGSYAPPPSGAYHAGWPEPPSVVACSRGDGGPEVQGQESSTGGAAVTTAIGGGSRQQQQAQGQPGAALPPTANHNIFPFAPPAIDYTADYGWLFDGMDPFGSSSGFPGLGRFDASRGRSQASGFSPLSSDGLGGFLGSFSGGGGDGGGGGQRGGGGGGDTASFGRGMSSDGFLMSGSEAEAPNALEDLAYFASLQAEIPSRVTYHVDPVAQHRLLVFLSSVGELPSSPLFTPSALRCYIYLFFSRFNRLYPLLHEPTFAASTTDPMLLSAVVVIGAHFAALPAHEMAIRIAQKIWGAIVSLEDFRPARATLPMLQAMVLTECFGKMMSSRPQHEMSHLFHNFIITLARRNAVFNPSVSTTLSQPTGTRYEEAEEFWRGWAREEEKKRIALFAFMLDAQHATTFRHIPALSAFQIQLNLPCSDNEWSKASPDAWTQHRRRLSYKPPSPFISALKACFSPGKTPHELDAFQRFVLLHGLMSIAYDLHWKQNILLGGGGGGGDGGGGGVDAGGGGGGGLGGGIGNWKDRLSAAYSSLQARMDIAHIKAEAEDDSSARLIHRATPSLVSAAQITLFADTIDIQIYAGLPSVLDRFIDRATFNASRRAVKEWAKTSDGTTAVWHAVNFLRTSLLGSGIESFGTIQPWKPSVGFAESDVRDRPDDDSPHVGLGGGGGGKESPDREMGLDEVLHHRWCQYLCALVIWAYGHALATPRGPQLATAPSTRPSRAVNNVPDAPFPLQGPYVRRSTAAGGGGGPGQPPLKPEAVDFLERMSTKSPDGIASVDCKCYTKSVLELVERELRGSRWELGREASGVLRKLITNHLLPDWERNDVNGTGSSSSSSNRNNQGSTGYGGSQPYASSSYKPDHNNDGGNTDGFKRPGNGGSGGNGRGDTEEAGSGLSSLYRSSGEKERVVVDFGGSGTNEGGASSAATGGSTLRDGGGGGDTARGAGGGNGSRKRERALHEESDDAEEHGDARARPSRRTRSSPGQKTAAGMMEREDAELSSPPTALGRVDGKGSGDGKLGDLGHGDDLEREGRASQQQVQQQVQQQRKGDGTTASTGSAGYAQASGGGGGLGGPSWSAAALRA